MAIYRNVQLCFWTDNKIEDEFTPEDKYFYLYLLTNPQTNICGCYEVSYNQLVNQTGYNKDTINRLLNRFENIHKVIKFSAATKEILVLHWYKYNWSKSEDTLKGVLKVAEHIKCEEFKKYVFSVVENIRDSKQPTPRIDTPMPSVTDADSIADAGTVDLITDIINYLNTLLKTKYHSNSKAIQRHIKARINEGFTFEDFKEVIDKKYSEWNGTDMAKFLRPETLFGTKFESYLNQKDNVRKDDDDWEGWENE